MSLEAEIQSDNIIDKAVKFTHFGKPHRNKINKNYGGNANESGLGLKLKSALRQVAYRKDGALKVKNEAVLQAETLNGNKPDKTAEEAYYGYQGRNRNQKNQGQYQNQGQGQARQYNNQSA